MAETRKSGEAREKELRLAIHRIQRGRAHTKVTKLSIAAVAREAGVSPALEPVRVFVGEAVEQPVIRAPA
ncbi:hypothetical protein [Burkholderia cenocepacia]|jgi:hypothetical protein|uniref:hypothetical protein n=1 Tax=Burkholderia cenocepacia TaxID=95486 RepID=UPI000A97246A|nr:hypothetical protein [Burkholderia cenocepacia]MCW5185274.1 hypothetical protein [Burkholderia cenocepacia]